MQRGGDGVAVRPTAKQVDDAIADAMVDANLNPNFCLSYAVALQTFGRAVWARAAGVSACEPSPCDTAPENRK